MRSTNLVHDEKFEFIHLYIFLVLFALISSSPKKFVSDHVFIRFEERNIMSMINSLIPLIQPTSNTY